MTQFIDAFKPENLFSRENPFLKSAEKAHRLVFEALDKTARLQLTLAADLLDMNRERFELLYARQSLSDLLTAQQNLASELGRRAARHAGDLQDVLNDMQAGMTEAANDVAVSQKPAKAAAKSKKAA